MIWLLETNPSIRDFTCCQEKKKKIKCGRDTEGSELRLVTAAFGHEKSSRLHQPTYKGAALGSQLLPIAFAWGLAV